MPRDSSVVPCVVFAFNRPDNLETVLAALRAQDIDRLIVFVDGSRDDADVELVERSRAIAKDVDWVDRELHFRDQNRGLPGLADNVSTVMSVHESAIFVEDDCLPMPSFYSFMRQTLARYEAESKVFSIGGYQPIPYKYFKDYPYSLVSSARFLCWAWATWQDRWALVAPYLSSYWELFDGLTNVPELAGDDLGSMARACAEGSDESWAVKVAISTLWLGQVHLLPTRGLVRNTGIGGGTHRESRRSTHRRERGHNNNVYEHSLENIVWLENVELNSDYGERLRQFVATPGLPLVSRVKSVLRRWPLLVSLWRSIRYTESKLRKRLFKPPPERLYHLDLREGRSELLTKRALLSYVVHPFSIPRDDPRFLRHINIWHAQEIVRILNQLGYTVDVVDFRDTSFVPRKRYDLFVGHGGINFQRIAQRLPDSAAKIYFSTGCYWKFHNGQELSRVAALRERRGVDLPPDRLIKDSEEGALLAADGVVGLGNGFTRHTYARFSPVTMVNSTALFDDRYEPDRKHFDKGRKHFLYFAGAGNVHKGLDLLLEAFVGLEQDLWICSSIDQRFAQAYSDELHNRSNVHLVGWIQPRSARFYELMNTCDWVILPSCAEGGSHSVVECMNQGLIPVVSRACGLDVEDYGVVLDPCTIEEMVRVVRKLSLLSPAECRHMSVSARKAAATRFSEATFSQSMEEAMRAIVQKKLPGTRDASQSQGMVFEKRDDYADGD